MTTHSPHCFIRGERFFSAQEAGEELGITRDRFKRQAEKLGVEPDGFYVNHHGNTRVYVWGRSSVLLVGERMGLSKDE